ncbi:Annexin, partial [Ancylostoma caninum]
LSSISLYSNFPGFQLQTYSEPKIHLLGPKRSPLQGISTRDKDLIRVLVSRAEIDLAAIQVEYERLFKKPLLQVIRDECKGAYRDALTSIVKGNRSHSYMN